MWEVAGKQNLVIATFLVRNGTHGVNGVHALLLVVLGHK